VNIKQAIALTGLVAATAGISPLAFAQDSGWYLGASGGQSKGKDSCPSLIPVGTSCDDTGSTYSVFGGYQVIKYIGVELGYTDLGKSELSGSGITNTTRVKGVELLGVGTIPITPQFEVYGKVGAFSWNLKESCTGATCTFSSRSETGTDLTYGLGAKFNFTKNVGVRVQYQRYKDVGNDATTGKNDIDSLSLGIVFKF
jgi:OOP family OmpA-OmpF porin